MTVAGTPWPTGTGEMPRLIRGMDWLASPLGTCEAWPLSLKIVLDLMLASRTEMVLFWGADYRVFYNDAYAGTLGLKHPHALSQPADVHWRESWAELEPRLRGVRATGQTFSAQDCPCLTNWHSDPEQGYVDVSYSAVRDETGQVAGVLCIVSEATQRLRSSQALASKDAALREEQVSTQQNKKAREQAESDLRQTHDQLRFAEAAGGIGTFWLEIASDILTVSSEFRRLFGLPASPTLLASTVESLCVQQQGDAISTHESRQRGDVPLNVEYRIRRADTRELRWISRRAEFVRDADGRPVWMRGVVQDVTERKLNEATLRESESRFRVLAQTVPNQVWSATPAGKLDWINQKVYEYAGLAEEQLLGEGWVQLLHPQDLQRVGAHCSARRAMRPSFDCAGTMASTAGILYAPCPLPRKV